MKSYTEIYREINNISCITSSETSAARIIAAALVYLADSLRLCRDGECNFDGKEVAK